MTKEEKFIKENFSVMKKLTSYYEMSLDEFEYALREILGNKHIEAIKEFVDVLETKFKVKDGRQVLIDFFIALALDAKPWQKLENVRRPTMYEEFIREL